MENSKFFRGKRQNEEKSLRECQIIRILPDESDDYMNIVRGQRLNSASCRPKTNVCEQLLCEG